MPCFNNLPRREDWWKNEKSWFYVGHNYFEASQCHRVLSSAQDGERTPGAKTRSSRHPGNKPMRRRVENALESEHRQKSIEKNVWELRIFYSDNWSPNLRFVISCTESATRSVLSLYILFSLNWKYKNVSFPTATVTFRRRKLAGAYVLRKKMNGHRWPKDSRQQKTNLRAMRRL